MKSFALLTLAASAIIFFISNQGRGDEKSNASCELAKVNWISAKEVQVDMTEYQFNPAEINLSKCQPYLLKLSNRGQKGHDLNSPGFFKSIIAKDERSERIETYPFDEIDVGVGKQASLLFVPMTKGKFNFKCDKFGHAAHGMKGTISVID